MRIKAIILYIVVFAIVFVSSFLITINILTFISGVIQTWLLLVLVLMTIGGASIASATMGLLKASTQKRPNTLRANINKHKITKGDMVIIECGFTNLDLNHLREPKITYVEGPLTRKRVQYQIINRNPDSNGVLIFFEENEFFSCQDRDPRALPLLFEQKNDIHFRIEFYSKPYFEVGSEASLTFQIINISQDILRYLNYDINNIIDLARDELELLKLELLKSKASINVLLIEFIFEKKKKKYWKLIDNPVNVKVI